MQVAARANRDAVDRDADARLATADPAAPPGRLVSQMAPFTHGDTATVTGMHGAGSPAPATRPGWLAAIGAGRADAFAVGPVRPQEPHPAAVRTPRHPHIAPAGASQRSDQPQPIDRPVRVTADQRVRVAGKPGGDDPQPKRRVPADPAIDRRQQAGAPLLTGKPAQAGDKQLQTAGEGVLGVAPDAAVPGVPPVADLVLPGCAVPDRNHHIVAAQPVQRDSQPLYIPGRHQARTVSSGDQAPRRQRLRAGGQEPSQRPVPGGVQASVAIAGNRLLQRLPRPPAGQPRQQPRQNGCGRFQFLAGRHDAGTAGHAARLTRRARLAW
jgi:hypothetical protein